MATLTKPNEAFTTSRAFMPSNNTVPNTSCSTKLLYCSFTSSAYNNNLVCYYKAVISELQLGKVNYLEVEEKVCDRSDRCSDHMSCSSCKTRDKNLHECRIVLFTLVIK